MMEVHIIEIVCGHYGISLIELAQKHEGERDTNTMITVRQTAAYLLWRFTQLNGDQIARLIGYKARQNVLAAKKTAELVAQGDKSYAETLNTLSDKILRK